MGKRNKKEELPARPTRSDLWLKKRHEYLVMTGVLAS